VNVNGTAVDALVDSIMSAIERHMKDPSDRTRRMKVVSTVGDGRYNVEVDGHSRRASAIDGRTYASGDVVWVKIPCGDWSSLLIIGKEVV